MSRWQVASRSRYGPGRRASRQEARRTTRFALMGVIIAGIALAGCAADLPRRPATLIAAPATAQPAEIRFARDVEVVPPSMYKRTIRVGSRWKLVGRIPEGDVYRPLGDGVFTVESAHVHEAYIVIEHRALVGVYLPVEKAFTAVERVGTLPLE